ncbi:MAG: flagellar hook-length control protein FliK [Burkholderiales bacterium]|nr:MAG: flagellar hook-length control protein FliK [Burkholderiales bacterium]
MTQSRPEAVPKPLALHDAMERSTPLNRLRERLDASNHRLSIIRRLLPSPLDQHVHAGPFDEVGWTLLADNAAVAAKLRQLQPRLEEALREAGLQVSATRVRIQPPCSPSGPGPTPMKHQP